MYKRINELLGTNYKNNKEIDWIDISANYNLSEKSIEEFKDKVDWELISINQTLSESFIRDFKDNIDLSYISMYQNLSESFIREFKDEVSWYYISSSQCLSENFIREFKERVDWNWISSNQVLSEDFIQEFKDYVDWNNISAYQILSWNFILSHQDLVNWYYISRYQPFVDSENCDKVDKERLEHNKLHHLYNETKYKRWFVGYVFPKGKNGDKYFTLESNSYNNPIKSKIYWRDLTTVNRIKNYEPIRVVKYVEENK